MRPVDPPRAIPQQTPSQQAPAAQQPVQQPMPVQQPQPFVPSVQQPAPQPAEQKQPLNTASPPGTQQPHAAQPILQTGLSGQQQFNQRELAVPPQVSSLIDFQLLEITISVVFKL